MWSCSGVVAVEEALACGDCDVFGVGGSVDEALLILDNPDSATDDLISLHNALAG